MKKSELLLITHPTIHTPAFIKWQTAEGLLWPKKIAYGGMVAEGALALLVILAVSAGLYWRGEGSLVYPILMKEKGWIVTFGEGYGQLVRPIFGTPGVFIAITMVNAFVITTLDSATRINRYITEELFSGDSSLYPSL